MKVKMRIMLAVKIAIASLIVFAVTLLFLHRLPYLRMFRFIRIGVKEAQQRKVRLLSETDHQALLEACRELSGKVSAGDLKPGRYIVRRKPHPEISRFPQLILDLEPTYLEIYNDGRVGVELVGGYHHCGVMAYPEDYKKPSRSYVYKNKRILDGLWYYEDDYNPDLDKYIEELIQKARKPSEN